MSQSKIQKGTEKNWNQIFYLSIHCYINIVILIFFSECSTQVHYIWRGFKFTCSRRPFKAFTAVREFLPLAFPPREDKTSLILRLRVGPLTELLLVKRTHQAVQQTHLEYCCRNLDACKSRSIRSCWIFNSRHYNAYYRGWQASIKMCGRLRN